MDELPCGFGDEPFVFPPDSELQNLKKDTAHCDNSCDNPCNTTKEQHHQSHCCKEPPPVNNPAGAMMEGAPKTKLCFKCKTEPGSILYKGESMCKACSLRNVEYKCRVNLQNKIKITSNDAVVVCLSGGMNSLCLANVLLELQRKFQKHLLFKSIEFVHVDLSVLNESPEEYRQKTKRLEEFAQVKSVGMRVIQLSELVGEKEIKLLMGGFQEGANHQDIVEIFLQRLIQKEYPQHLIALGTSGQRTASNILKYLVKGQGGSLQELGWKESNKILPLRQHLTKQIQFYFYMNKLDSYSFEPPSLFSKNSNPIGSIDSILQDFIDNLQDGYPHTCPTILRTSEKIKLSHKGSKCSFCQSYTNAEDRGLCVRCENMVKEWKGEEGLRELLPKGFDL